VAIADTGSVDIVVRHPYRDEVFLLLVGREPWSSSAEQRRLLRAKLETYAAYAVSGDLARIAPDDAGKQIVVQLLAPETGCALADDFRAEAERVLGPRGLVSRVDRDDWWTSGGPEAGGPEAEKG
jgi:hypothetical protein